MSIIIRVVVLLFLLNSVMFGLDNKDLSVNIDLCGKERMLTQKMLKEIFLIKSDINKKENIKRLKDSSKLFDKILNGLINGDKSLNLTATKNPNIQKQLEKVSSLWKPIQKDINSILNNSDNKEIYSKITKDSDTLLDEVNKAVELYTKEDKNNFLLANDMNLAGKQRMLLEKMATLLLMINNDIDTKKSKREFLKSQKLFTRTLHGLSKGDKKLGLRGTNLPMITAQIEKVDNLWKSDANILKTALSGKETPKAISSLDTLLDESDKLVKLYTASLKRYKQRQELKSLVKVYKSLEEMDSKTKILLKELAKTEIKK